MATEKKLEELLKLYSEADETDKEIFAEMRSNILLVAGDHYSKINSRISSQIRNPQTSPGGNDPKLRITKNHVHKIQRSYVSSILSEAPGTGILPQRDTELQDQKDAELNQSVWDDIKYRHKIKEKTREWCNDFVTIGEVVSKMFWDPNAGKFLGYGPKVDEAGEPVMKQVGVDPMTGAPLLEPETDEENPIFQGDFVFETGYGFNTLREKGTDDMREKDRAWILRKMCPTQDLKFKYRHDQEKVSKITESANETYIVFDAAKGGYHKNKGETLVLEYYWDKCTLYPNGYFVYMTKNCILEQGPLPEGIFPLVWSGFSKFQTSPRGRSIIKVVRPYQAEINRASSSMATAQVTMGDDKIIYNAGSKLQPGALLPGVRGISKQGGDVTILPGRSGAQYLDYVSGQISEMYMAAMVDENDNQDKSGQIDAFTLLFRAASKKRRYSEYIEKFESFLVEVTEKCLEIAKAYLPDDMLISAVGKREIINISEFRKTSPLNYQIKVEPRADTLETQFGKQLQFQQIIQYVGKQLDQKTIGKLIRNAPFGNFEDSFEDLTLDEDNAKNDMLALERGEAVQAEMFMDPSYMIKKLSSRKKKADFKYLAKQIQDNYNVLINQYEQIFAAEQQKILAAKNEFIPVDGALVTCDFYINDPAHPENQAKRAKIPQRALEWLLKRLEEQGMSLDKLEGMNAQSLSDLAEMILANKGNKALEAQQGQMQVA